MRWDTYMQTFWKDFDTLIATVNSSVSAYGDRTAEDDQKFSLEVDIPGIAPADISVEVKDRKLLIKGTGKRTIDRDYLLPESVDAAAVTASCDLGVLTVTLPKSKASSGRKVEVKVP